MHTGLWREDRISTIRSLEFCLHSEETKKIQFMNACPVSGVMLIELKLFMNVVCYPARSHSGTATP